MPKMDYSGLNVGIITPGLAAYWSQMPGSRATVEESNARIVEILAGSGNVINFGICDSIEIGREISGELNRREIDLLILHIGTYCTSKYLIPFLRKCTIPILTLHLQPVSGFKTKSSSDVTIPRNAFSMAGELGAVANRLGVRFCPVAGQLNKDSTRQEIMEWVQAVKVKKQLEQSNVALVGNIYNGMCDLYADITQLMGDFGINCEFLEIADIREYFERISDSEISEKYLEVKSLFNFDSEITKEKIALPLKVAAALDAFTADRQLNAVAFHSGGFPESIEEKIGYSMTLGGSILTGKKIPFIAEGDVCLSIPMIIFNILGFGASQTEVNVADFDEGVIFMSHSGPGDISMAAGRPELKWLDFFHGRRGSGVSCGFGFKKGPVTLLSLTRDSAGRYKFVAAEGEIKSDQKLNNGNVNSAVDFGMPIREFIEKWTLQGPTHHSVIGHGRNIKLLRKVADVLKLELIEIGN
jgi:L-arabinose isomerase